MALTIDPATKTVTIPQSDLTLVNGSLYSADTNQIRKDLMTLLASEDYIWMDDAFIHNTEYTVAGVTYARALITINGWSYTFSPDSQWSARLEGSNNDWFDVENGVLNQNQVQVIPTNSAGLITVTTGSGLSTEQDTKLSEMHQDMGLKSGSAVTITENAADTSYDQTSTGITKEIRTSGSTKTITRS